MWESLDVLLKASVQASPRIAAAILLLTLVERLAQPLVALLVKMLADAITLRASNEVEVAVLGLGFTFGIGAAASWAAFTLRMTQVERAQNMLDGRIITLATQPPGLDHFEHPQFLNQVALLRRDHRMLAWGTHYIVDLVANIFRLLLTSLLLASVHPVLAAFPLVAAPLLLLEGRAAKLRYIALDHIAENSRVGYHLFSVATDPGAAKELRVFGAGPELVRRFRIVQDEVRRLLTRSLLRGAGLVVLGWLVIGLGYVTTLAVSATQLLTGRATIGDMFLVMIIAGQVNELLGGTAQAAGGAMRALDVSRRFVWLRKYAQSACGHGKDHLPDRLVRGIDFERVTFAYRGSPHNALENVTLTLPRGTVVALVGDNGAGKTTLAKLLCRFYDPSQGRITADGVDLGEFDPSAWRVRISATFQDFARFEVTAGECVGIGNLDHANDSTAIRRALDRAGSSDLLDQLPQGENTQLGVSWGGVDLSHGEWQQLALGRAMMRQAPLLLVLDEPTASLHPDRERALFERYAAAARHSAVASGGITILVSHRFSSVRMADLIVVLSKGRVVESGSHEELLKQGGVYAEWYHLQAKAYH